MNPIGDTMPAWARQMPAFVLDASGEKEDARKIIEEILETTEDLHPNEVNFMAGYLENDLKTPKEDVDRILAARKEKFKPYDPDKARPTMPVPMPE
jgi:hypothetical protein